jgi:hypothetical protein
MTIQTLFGTEEVTIKPRSIKFKQIKAVYETLNVNEPASSYFSTGTRYTAPSQVYESFKFLMRESHQSKINPTSNITNLKHQLI